MNKGYAAGDIERKAKEVLSTLQVSCPDTVWQELNIELEQRHSSIDARWKNRLSTPRTLVIVLLVVSGSAFGAWKYLSNKAEKTPVVIAKPTPPPAPAPKPVRAQSPPVVKKDTVKHDTVAPTKAPVQNTNTPSPPVAVDNKTQPVSNNTPPLTDQQKMQLKAKHDSLMVIRRHWRDSVNAVRAHNKHIADSLKHLSAAPVHHDSVPATRHDSI